MNGMDMGGMDMGDGLFTATNKSIAIGFWYGVAGCVGMLTLFRMLASAKSRYYQGLRRKDQCCVPSKPQGWLSQVYATALAVAREIIYPQPVYLSGQISRYFSPLPIGRWLLLAVYWTALLVFLWSDTILSPGDPMYAYKWEKVAFRAAWVSVTQVPFIYLLSCKFNVISLLTGISYERFNWLHRWSARTLFLTAIVHWSFFYQEWSLADIVALEFEMMPMVKYGFGAWGVITWMILSSFGIFRQLYYELFVVQHLAAAGALLWCLYMHVPSYARYNLWMAIGFVAFDWSARIVGGIIRNAHFMGGAQGTAPGYPVHLEALAADVVRLTIEDIDFDWRAGQHAYIFMPGLRLFEIHPFTIASAPCRKERHQGRQMSMVIQARSGFTRSLHRAALRAEGHGMRHRAFISGPWGIPPDLKTYETVVCIACSTGASFIMPLLLGLVTSHSCVDNVIFHWIIRNEEQEEWFRDEVNELFTQTRTSKLRLKVHIHVTRSAIQGSSAVRAWTAHSQEQAFEVDGSGASTLSEENRSSDSSMQNENVSFPSTNMSCSLERVSSLTRSFDGRPSVESMIRPTVEQARGETGVVVCGGLSITAQSRSFVAKLSDERAVHKGTGAQGISLFTETYGW